MNSPKVLKFNSWQDLAKSPKFGGFLKALMAGQVQSKALPMSTLAPDENNSKKTDSSTASSERSSSENLPPPSQRNHEGDPS